MKMVLAAVAVIGPVVFGAASPAAAAPAYPQPDGRCVDQTGVLSPLLCAQVTAVLLRDEAGTSDEIAVAVVPTTGDAGIETWSTGLVNTWGVGKEGADNGILLVVAVNDHHLRITTGRGMSGRLTDGQANEIINTTITPQFAQGAYAAGILAGLDEIRRKVGHTIPAGGELVTLTSTATGPASAAPAGPVPAAGLPAGDVPAGDVPAWGDPVPPAGAAGPFDVAGMTVGLSGGLCLLLFLLLPIGAVLTLVSVLNRKGVRRSRSFGHPPQSRRRHTSASASQSFWGAGHSGGSAGFSDSGGSAGFSDSGSSGSSFGGGGSDGGGSSGSW
jgi:uncharacterized protein